MTQSDTLNPIGFKRRQITLKFDIVRKGGTKETVEFNDLYRIRALVVNAGMSSGRKLELAIEGLPLETMNRLSYIGQQIADNHLSTLSLTDSTITVKAGVLGESLSTVFYGNVAEAYADYSAAPDVLFRVTAADIIQYDAKAAAPYSIKGQLTATAIASELCSRNGLVFIDHGGWGKNPTLYKGYICGTLKQQLTYLIMDWAKGYFRIDPNGSKDAQGKQTSSVGIVHVWGPDAKDLRDQESDPYPVISSKTGMIGYPQYSVAGCRLQTLFRPELTFLSRIRLDSDYIPAAWARLENTGENTLGAPLEATDKPLKAPWTGQWVITHVSHDISSEIPAGPWLTQVECTLPFNLKNIVV